MSGGGIQAEKHLDVWRFLPSFLVWELAHYLNLLAPICDAFHVLAQHLSYTQFQVPTTLCWFENCFIFYQGSGPTKGFPFMILAG